MKEPVEIEKAARDVTPYEHGIYCSIAKGEPFVNPIVMRRWSDDGEQIVFMLDSCNFDFRRPDELMRVVEREQPDHERRLLPRRLAEDAAAMATRPDLVKCETCGGTGRIRKARDGNKE